MSGCWVVEAGIAELYSTCVEWYNRNISCGQPCQMPKGQIGYCANGKHLNVSHLIKLNASNIATSSHMKFWNQWYIASPDGNAENSLQTAGIGILRFEVLKFIFRFLKKECLVFSQPGEMIFHLTYNLDKWVKKHWLYVEMVAAN